MDSAGTTRMAMSVITGSSQRKDVGRACLSEHAAHSDRQVSQATGTTSGSGREEL
jgi:hypothetical protein